MRKIGILLVALAAYLSFSHGSLPFLTSAPSLPSDVSLARPYMATDGARPVSWNSCAPIDYVVNLSGAPSFAKADLDAAMAKISAATGFRFVQVGQTSQIPQANWADSQRLGRSGWAPLIIAFATPKQSNLFDAGADQLGNGGSAWVQGPRGKVDVSGEIIINSATSYDPGFGAGTHLASLFLHELGHVVGLSHSPDPNSFMYPYLGVVSQTITPLDAQHLAALSAGGCHPAPAPGW